MKYRDFTHRRQRGEAIVRFQTVGDIRQSQYVHPQQPPDKEYRNDGPRDVNDPVSSCFRFSEIEHAAMVAGCPETTLPAA
jgi:hypothetical protein